MSRTHKFGKEVIGWERGRCGLTVNGYGVYFGKDENVLVYSVDGYTTLYTLNVHFIFIYLLIFLGTATLG